MLAGDIKSLVAERHEHVAKSRVSSQNASAGDGMKIVQLVGRLVAITGIDESPICNTTARDIL
jgi:hypothetical protein